MGKVLIGLALAVTAGLVYFTLAALGMVGDNRSPSERMADNLASIGAEFEADGHLPWDNTAEVQKVQTVGDTLKITVRTAPELPDTIAAIVCNYRDLRELIYDGAEIEIIWKPAETGRVMGTTSINYCPSLRG